MNKVILMGRLTKDPELRTTQGNVSVVTFTLAVDRRFKNANGEREADFIRCLAWRQVAEAIARYCTQGTKIAIDGWIQTRTWEDDQGRRNYVTEVVADSFEFAESKRTAEQHSANGNNSCHVSAQYAQEYQTRKTQAEESERVKIDSVASGDDRDYFDDSDNLGLPFDL